MTASLYLHIPFCASLCDYCDFYSVEVPKTDVQFYLEMLCTDIEQQIQQYNINEIPSLYIGGGTPSVLGARRIEWLFKRIHGIFPGYIPEITVEANPESVNEDFLDACLSGGATRLSIGIQTFYEKSRQALNRAGDPHAIMEKLELITRFFPESFSVDLMTGLPFQTEAQLREDINRVCSCSPGHISLYSLTVEPSVPFFHLLPLPDQADALYCFGRDLLEQYSYMQYEVSNFARPGKRCQHNIRYWRMQSWLGAGAAASGTIIDEKKGTGTRRTYNPDIENYFRHDAVEESLDQLTLVQEMLLMGFRYIEGPDEGLFKNRFGINLESYIPETLDSWKHKGMIQPGKNALTPEGLLFLNRFLIQTFEEIENRS
ncbi:coproporphyrinogen III oxidase [Spirochaetia bacterium]|nr:coproporphyrinogen III oxidase [Spirochaetia bacterium]GHU33453.1 coproporphyrinogen III oxidase [Spirochaetia bacterium]